MTPAARPMAVLMSEEHQPHYSCLHTENCDGSSSQADGSGEDVNIKGANLGPLYQLLLASIYSTLEDAVKVCVRACT